MTNTNTREIKFRAWDLVGKQMINHISSIEWERDNSLGKLHSHGDLDIVNGQNSGHYTREPWEYELLEYTGLKDKNGKEIYEGDLVKSAGKFRQIIGFDSTCSRYCFVYDTGEPMRNIGRAEVKRLEVVGNIYEGLHSCEKTDIVDEWNSGTKTQSQKPSKDAS